MLMVWGFNPCPCVWILSFMNMMRLCILLIFLLIVPAYSMAQGCMQQLSGYFASWDDTGPNSEGATWLSNIPSYFTHIIVFSAQPDLVYAPGSLVITGTGLQFPYSGAVLKKAIAQARLVNPTVKIELAVGSGTYVNWGSLNVPGVKALVADMGFDGVEIDYENGSPGCNANGDGCATDGVIEGIIKSLRAALPRPLLLTASVQSTGAYDTGCCAAQMAAVPSAYAGIYRVPLQSVGGLLDMLSIQAYDSGTSYSPLTAWSAYKALFSGNVLIGMQAYPEGYEPTPPHIWTTVEIDQMANGEADGMMLYTVSKPGVSYRGVVQPSSAVLATEVCNEYGLGNCAAPMPPTGP